MSCGSEADTGAASDGCVLTNVLESVLNTNRRQSAQANNAESFHKTSSDQSFSNVYLCCCSDSNSASDSSSSSSQSEAALAKPSSNNNTSRGSKSDADHIAKSDNTSPDGTDEDTRTGAITSSNNASQYHNDNGTEDSDPEDSDAISNHSDQQFSSSKSSIDVSCTTFHWIFLLQRLILFWNVIKAVEF